MFQRALNGCRCVLIKRFCSVKSTFVKDPSAKPQVTVEGWVRAARDHKNVRFINLSDGSCHKSIQVVIPEDCHQYPYLASYGSCVKVKGTLQESNQPQQGVEVKAESVEVLGYCSPKEYPFKFRKKHSSDYLRQFLHLRPKTITFSTLLRVRNAATQAIHKFFQDEGFLEVHTPILTSNDCEGAGEVFKVEPADKTVLAAANSEYERSGTDNSQFFNTTAYLTVSGQLHLEAVNGAFSKVYTFSPTFRAENSRGRHHLSEFHMVEAELAFTESLEDILNVAERLLKSCTQDVLERVHDDVTWYWKNVAAAEQEENVKTLLIKPFIRMTYDDAIAILLRNNDNFTLQAHEGCDLQKEHERFLVSHCGGAPVFVTDFPEFTKPFYMRTNSQRPDTVAAVDLLVPEIGELIGGSLREERLPVLEDRLRRHVVSHDLSWYLDLRRFGSAPHGGFGLGFERYLQFLLGVSNIRDCIPFPRSPKNCVV